MALSPVFDVIKTAARDLARIGTDKAINALVKSLQHENSSIRIQAAVALIKNVSADKVINDEAIDILIGLIHALQDQNSAIRKEARWAVISCLEALIRSGNKKALDAISPLLHHENPNVSISAAAALGQIGSDEAIDALIQGLQKQDYFVKETATKALGKIGNDKAIDALIEALQNENSSGGRSDIAEALGQIGSATCLEKLLQSADPNLIYRPDIFPLARTLAIRFSKIGHSFIPVYPECLKPSKVPNK